MRNNGHSASLILTLCFSQAAASCLGSFLLGLACLLAPAALHAAAPKPPALLGGHITALNAAAQTFSMNDGQGTNRTWRVDAQTTYEVNGRPGSFADLAVGAQVSVSLRSSDPAVAAVIKVVPARAPKPAGP